MKIAVIGSITRDQIVIKKRNERFHQVGGGVYYAAMALANLGVDVIAVPLLAKNDSDLLASLKHPKIEILPQWTAKTTIYKNTYPENSFDVCDKKIFSSAKGYQLTEDTLEKIKETSAVHLAPLSSEEFNPSIFQKLRKKYSKMISLDGQGFTKGPPIDLKSILHNNIDIIKLDDFEASYITNHQDEAKAISTMSSWNISEILITKASKGSTLHYNDETHQISAHNPKEIVDATGCGDTYIAAYLAKSISGSTPIESAHFASKIAPKKLEYKGALKELFHL